MSQEHLRHFMNHPDHPYWLHCACHPIVLIMIATLVITMIGPLLKVSTLLTFLIVMFTWSSSSQLVWFEGFMGHGTPFARRPIFSFMKIPSSILSVLFLTIMLSVLLIVTDLFILKKIFIVEPEFVNVYKFISLSLLITFCAILISWRYHLYYVTFYRDEEVVYNYYKQQGWQKIDINLRIQKLRFEGELPWI